MEICLVDVDSKIPNVALMKISSYHKSIGDNVSWYDPLLSTPDKIYASKIFDFTNDYEYFPDDIEIIKGGSGYSLETRLPDEIEHSFPDYDIYGGANTQSEGSREVVQTGVHGA